MPEQSSIGGRPTLEAQVLAAVSSQLSHEDPAERSRAYGIIENLLQRDYDLERARQERELQLEFQAREEQRHSTRRAVLSILGLCVIIFTAGVILALRGFQDIGLFLLGCTAAFLGEALVSYK